MLRTGSFIPRCARLLRRISSSARLAPLLAGRRFCSPALSVAAAAGTPGHTRFAFKHLRHVLAGSWAAHTQQGYGRGLGSARVEA